jgi:uncharacterized protein YecT (DUF1311 family)
MPPNSKSYYFRSFLLRRNNSGRIALLLTIAWLGDFERGRKLMEEKTDIDRKIDALLKRDSTTQGMGAAMIEGYRLWDNELNRVYKELSAKLPTSQKGQLQASQRLWIAWRDAEFKLIDAMYSKVQGSMSQADRRYDRMEIVHQRALELRRLNKLAQQG